MIAFFIVKKKRQSSTEGRPDQNAPKDQSEALHIDMDGSNLAAAVKSMNSAKSSNTERFEFDGVSVEVGAHSKDDNPSFEVTDSMASNAKANRNGHIL